MLQINTTNFASDALEDAMRLAQTKALNSYTFSDCLNYLNYSWRDIYDRVACIDDGYYGINVRVTKKLIRLPRFVKNTVQVYYAQSPVGYDRVLLRESGTTDMVGVTVMATHTMEAAMYRPTATPVPSVARIRTDMLV